MTTSGGQDLRQHTLHMERRKHISLTGVSDVSSFHEHEVVLKVDSATMIVTGENMHIGKLLIEDGRLDIDGQIDSIIYEKPRPDIKRIFPWHWSSK